MATSGRLSMAPATASAPSHASTTSLPAGALFHQRTQSRPHRCMIVGYKIRFMIEQNSNVAWRRPSPY